MVVTEHMAPNNSNDPLIDIRREQVARFLARKMTQRQIVAGLVAKDIFNPETGEAYSLTTVNADVKALRKEYRSRANQKVSEWIAEELADLDQLEFSAWADRNLELVLKVKTRRAKLLGLDAPEKQELSGPGKDGAIVLRWADSTLIADGDNGEDE